MNEPPVDPIQRAMDRADTANKAVDELKGELKSSIQALRDSWGNDLRQFDEHYGRRLEALDTMIRGDGNGIKGIANRMGAAESKLSGLMRITWLIVGAISTILVALTVDWLKK